ncbi:DNA-3-methyladenine glycosylase II [Cytobacillus horneckiae]|uniref:DNA-3-methyladenine glycosylase II n=2 Tax=Cytobacillus horneckiae TaxID=549687 RepID=A0A2N0ZK61_9BACI|nr:DNA-3-methyladenine glycosylase 2 family protein [Cytobacillus horneckiae]
METINIQGPYNFDLVLDRLKMDPLHHVDLQKRAVKVPMMIKNEPIVAEVTAIGTTDHPAFEISGIEHSLKEQALDRLKELFKWHLPLDGIYNHFQQTDLKELFTAHYGTPLVLDFDPYSCLLKCIVHQQLNLKFAHTLTERFVKTFGFQQDGAWFYPQPEKLAQIKVEELRELQFSGRKAEYAIGVATAVMDGQLDFEKLKNMSDADIHDKLIKLRGVGPWTVQNFLMFGLGRPNLYPLADIGIQNALKKHYQLEAKPTYAEMEDYAKDWHPYLSYASLYLWRSIE